MSPWRSQWDSLTPHLQPELVRLGWLLLLGGRPLRLLEDGLHDVLAKLLPQLGQTSYQLVSLHSALGRLVALSEGGVQVRGVHVLQPHVLGDAAQVEVTSHTEAAVRAFLPVVGLLVTGEEGVDVGGAVIEAVPHHHLLGLAHGHVLVAGGARPHLTPLVQILSLGLQHLQLRLLQLQHLLADLLADLLVDPGVLPLGLLGEVVYEVLLPLLRVLHLPAVRQGALWLGSSTHHGLRLCGLWRLWRLVRHGRHCAARGARPIAQSSDLVGVQLLKLLILNA